MTRVPKWGNVDRYSIRRRAKHTERKTKRLAWRLYRFCQRYLAARVRAATNGRVRKLSRRRAPTLRQEGLIALWTMASLRARRVSQCRRNCECFVEFRARLCLLSLLLQSQSEIVVRFSVQRLEA